MLPSRPVALRRPSGQRHFIWARCCCLWRRGGRFGPFTLCQVGREFNRGEWGPGSPTWLRGVGTVWSASRGDGGLGPRFCPWDLRVWPACGYAGCQGRTRENGRSIKCCWPRGCGGLGRRGLEWGECWPRRCLGTRTVARGFTHSANGTRMAGLAPV